MRTLILFLIIILSLKNISYASVQNKILVNVGNNQIITSYELKNRIKTILILNNKELNQENVNKTKRPCWHLFAFTMYLYTKCA